MVSRAFGMVLLLVGLLLVTVLKRSFTEFFLVGLTALGALVAVAAIVVGVLFILPRRVSRSSDTFGVRASGARPRACRPASPGSRST